MRSENEGNTDASERADDTWRLLALRAFAWGRERIASQAAECDLSIPQAMLMRELDAPLSQRKLARRLHYDPSNITALADALEKRGLVERRPDPADRRIRTLALTEQGRQLKSELIKKLSGPIVDAILQLSEAEQVQLHSLLAKLFSHEAERYRSS